MKIFIYGAGNVGKLALELMRDGYKMDHDIVGFIDKNKSGQYLGYPIYKLEDIEGFDGKIIIALFSFNIAKSACQDIKKRGFKDIFWFQYKKGLFKYDNFFVEQCNDCRLWKDDLMLQVEMHIIDSCNLNCRGCSHFSPIFPDALPDLSSRLLDVKHLNEKISHIVRFYILGGEPFLNPEINSYIYGIRKILPETQLYIVTNGLLIERLDEEILQCIKENRVWVSISEYPPTHKRIDYIRKVLDRHRIFYEIRDASERQNFNLPFSLSENSKYPRTCISNGCVSIWNGKIARCPQLMYTPYFNSYFKTGLPEEGVMELEHCLSGVDLLQALNQEVPLCKHCIQKKINWSVCGKNAKLEDFSVLD